MKKSFEGVIHHTIPDNIYINKWQDSKKLKKLQGISNTPFSLISHPDYICTEYLTKLNLFTFGRLKLNIPMTVIAPPLSVDCAGFRGDINRLIADYKRRKGLFLILNITEKPVLFERTAVGNTLPSNIFYNRFCSFEDYLNALRSHYRRRINLALKKGAQLRVSSVLPKEFTAEMYQLYLQVLHRSKYPLETLDISFFRNFDGEIFGFYECQTPIAFVAVKSFENELDFVFGGMAYSKRDEFDLYYNMLLLILRQGIAHNVQFINFGQTAEHSKQRIGCTLSKRYMIAFSGNKILNRLLCIFKKALEYKIPDETYEIFRR